jgi:hypothetical protein
VVLQNDRTDPQRSRRAHDDAQIADPGVIEIDLDRYRSERR